MTDLSPAAYGWEKTKEGREMKKVAQICTKISTLVSSRL
jgi:hypothetical protein